MLNLKGVKVTVGKVNNKTLSEVLTSINAQLQLAGDAAYNYSELLGGGHLDNCTVKLSLNREALVPFMVQKGYLIETKVPVLTNKLGKSNVNAPTPFDTDKYSFYHELGKALTHYALFNLHLPVVGAYIATGLIQPTAYIFTRPKKPNNDVQAPVIELSSHPHKHQNQQGKKQSEPSNVKPDNIIKQKEHAESQQRFLTALHVASLKEDTTEEKAHRQTYQQHWQAPSDDGPEL